MAVDTTSMPGERLYTPTLNKVASAAAHSGRAGLGAFFGADDEDDNDDDDADNKNTSTNKTNEPQSRQRDPHGATDDTKLTPASGVKRQRAGGKKKSAMEELKDELAQRQERRDQRGLSVKETLHEFAREDQRSRHSGDRAAAAGNGSHDDGDPNTTNVFVGHLHQHVREDVLFRLFRRYGPIGSLKIMWPRTGEEHARGYNSAFIAYSHREDAARALDDLMSLDLYGIDIKINWGKAVALIPGVEVQQRQFDALATNTLRTLRAKAAADGQPRGAEPIFVVPPLERSAQHIIDTAASFVAEHGASFERALAQREKTNAQYAFLRDGTTPDAQYYRWRVYSLLRGDSLRRWRTKPFQM